MTTFPHQKILKASYQLVYLPQALRLVWQACPRWTMTWGALLFVQGILPIGVVTLTRSAVNAAAAYVHGAQGFASLLGLLVVLGLAMLLIEMLNALLTYVRGVQSELVQDHVTSLVHQQALALDLSYYETPEYYDSLHRAHVDAVNQPLMLLENLGSVMQTSLTLGGMALVLAAYAGWLPLILVGSSLPALWAVGKFTLTMHRWRLRNTYAERRLRYFSSLISLREAAMEIRLFNLGPHFHEAYSQIRARLRSERFGITRAQMKAEMMASSTALAGMGICAWWLLHQTAQGKGTLGDLALFFQVFSQSQGLLRTLLRNAGGIYNNLLFLENLFDFLDLEPRLVQIPLPSLQNEERSQLSMDSCFRGIDESVELSAKPLSPLRGALRLEEVTFTYPGAQHPVFKDFSITFRAGQITAIVGDNGAGKSTLCKLLCRLYDPDSGRVTWDGEDVRTYTPEALHREITVLLQEPVRYHASTRENIVFGDVERNPTQEEIEGAVRAASATALIQELPKGYDTILGKWFGGSELSGGEWQRLAVARAFIRKASLLMLDEPTSAMDSWSEAAWYQHFKEMVRGRTALLITHRFTTAMQADLIYVMREGKVVESGSHAELIASKGYYAHSWDTQMKAGKQTPLPVSGTHKA